MSQFARTGDADADYFVHGSEHKATCAAMFAAALAPLESCHPLAFAADALRQISADLVILEAALSEVNERDGGPLNSMIVRRAIVGLEGRARVAAEVISRLSDAERTGGRG